MTLSTDKSATMKFLTFLFAVAFFFMVQADHPSLDPGEINQLEEASEAVPKGQDEASQGEAVQDSGHCEVHRKCSGLLLMLVSSSENQGYKMLNMVPASCILASILSQKKNA